MGSMTTLAEYRSDPIAFIERELVDPETRKPFVLLDAEREFLKYAFEFDDDGRLRYPEMVFGAPKKSGKTGFAALFTLTLVLLYGGAYAEGACAANDFEQAQARVFQAIKRIVECSPMLRSEARITSDRVVFPASGATIAAIASDYAGAAGGNQCISTFDELWGFASEKSRRLFDEMVPPPTKQVSCRLTVTYAGFEGESILLEELYRRGKSLPEVGPSLRAGEGMLFFWSHEPIAPWQTPEWIEQMRASLRPNQFARMIRNEWTSSESAFISMSAWDECTDPDLTPVAADKSMPIWIGIDASTRRDSTAVVGVTFDKANQRVRLVAHSIFIPTAAEPIDFEAVERAVLDLHRRFKIQMVWFDPFQFAASSQRLQRAGVPIEEYPQTIPNICASSQNLYELVMSRGIIVYPDDQFRLAVSRAIAVEGPRGWHISKQKASHRIDCVIALSMAALAAVQGGHSTYSHAAMADGLGELVANLVGGGGGFRDSPVPQPDREAARQATVERMERQNAQLKRDGDAAYRAYCMSGGRFRGW
jgi:phage terminase large subunit-like protein